MKAALTIYVATFCACIVALLPKLDRAIDAATAAPEPATNVVRVDPYYRWTTNEWVGEAWSTNEVFYTATNFTTNIWVSGPLVYYDPFPITCANYGRPFVLEGLVTNRVRGATNVYLRVSRDGRTNDFQLWP